MARRIWIIVKKNELDSKDYEDAKNNNCPEIVNGIPPALIGIVSETDLPCAYDEPEVPPPEPPRDLAAEIDELNIKVGDHETRLKTVERKPV